GIRSRALGSDLDLLLLAFQHGVVQAPHPKMLDPRAYTTQAVYVNFAGPPSPITSRQTLLASPKCQLQPRTGFHRVTLAESQQVAGQAAGGPGMPGGAAAAATATSTSQPPGRSKQHSGTPSSARSLKVGEICPVCHAEFRVRPLLQGTYVGCL